MARYTPRTITKRAAALGYLLAGSVLACEDHQHEDVVTVEVVSTVYLDLDVCRNACSTPQALDNNPAAGQPTTTVDLTLPIYDAGGASVTAYASTKTADNKDCRGTVFHYQPTNIPYVTETASHSEATHSIKTVQPTCEACSGTVWIYEPTGSACGSVSGSGPGVGSIVADGAYPTATLSGAAAGSTTQTIYIPGHSPIVIVGDLPAIQGFPLDPATGFPKDPQTGRLIDPATGLPLLIDPSTGCAVDPSTGLPLPGCAEQIDTKSGCAIDASTGRPLPGCLSALGPEMGLTGSSNSGSGPDSSSGSENESSSSSGSYSTSSSGPSPGSGPPSDPATCSVPKSSEAEAGFTYGIYNIHDDITDLMYIDALDFARPIQISKGLAPFGQSVDAKQPQVYNARAWIYVCEGGNYRFETPGVDGDVAFWIGENALSLLSPPAAHYCGTGSSQMLDPKFQVEGKESSTADDNKTSESKTSTGSSKDSSTGSSYTYGCAKENSMIVNIRPGTYTPVRVVCVLGSGKCLFRIANEQGEIMFDNTQGSIIQAEKLGIFTERVLDGSYPKKHPAFPEGSNSGKGLVKGKNPYENDGRSGPSRVTIVGDEDQDGRPDEEDGVSAVIIPSRESGREGSDYQGFKTQVEPDNVNNVTDATREVLGSSPSENSKNIELFDENNNIVGYITPTGEIIHRDGTSVTCAVFDVKIGKVIRYGPGGGDCQTGKKGDTVIDSFPDPTKKWDLTDKNGKVVGTVTPSGEIRDGDKNIVKDHYLDRNSNTVVRAPKSPANKEDLIGSELGSVADGKLVKNGETVGSVKPSKEILDNEGNVVEGFILDPKTSTAVRTPGADTTFGSGDNSAPDSGRTGSDSTDPDRTGSVSTDEDDVYGSTRDPANDSNLVKDGDVVGTIDPSGAVKDKNGNDVPQAVFHPSLNFVIRRPRPSGGNGSVVGSSPEPSRNNNLVNDEGNIVGSVKPNGEALDKDGAVVDKVVLNPETNQVTEGSKDDLSNDREVIGSSPDPSGKNNLLDEDGNIVGFIGDNGDIIDREGQPTDAVLDPETNEVVEGPKDDLSNDREVIGSTPDPSGNGNLVDKDGNVVGSIGPDGEIRDVNDDPVDGASLDSGSNTVVRDPSSVPGGNGSGDDSESPVVGSSPDPSGNGNLVDEDGSVVGSIGPDGEIRDVNNNPVEGATLNPESNTVVGDPSSGSGSGGNGSSDDFDNSVIGSSPDPSGNGDLLDSDGNIVGSIDDNGNITDTEGNPVDATLDPTTNDVVPTFDSGNDGNGSSPNGDVVDPAPGNTNEVIGSTSGPNDDLVDSNGNTIGSVDDNGNPTDAALDSESNPSAGSDNGNTAPGQDSEPDSSEVGSGNGTFNPNTSDGSTPIGSTPGGPSGNDLIDEAGNVVGSLGPDGQVNDVDGNPVDAVVDPSTGTVVPTTPDSGESNSSNPSGSGNNNGDNPAGSGNGNATPGSSGGSSGTDLVDENGNNVGSLGPEGGVADNNGNPVDAVVDPNTGVVTPSTPGYSAIGNTPGDNVSGSTTPGTPDTDVIGSSPGGASGNDLINENGDKVGSIGPNGEILDNNGNPVDAVLDPDTNTVVPTPTGDNGGSGNTSGSNDPGANNPGTSTVIPTPGDSNNGNSGTTTPGENAPGSSGDSGSPVEAAIEPVTNSAAPVPADNNSNTNPVSNAGDVIGSSPAGPASNGNGNELKDPNGNTVGTITPDGEILDNNGEAVDAILDPATNTVVPSTVGGDDSSGDGSTDPSSGKNGGEDEENSAGSNTPGEVIGSSPGGASSSGNGNDLVDSDGNTVGTITSDGQILDSNGEPVDAVLDAATNVVVPSTPSGNSNTGNSNTGKSNTPGDVIGSSPSGNGDGNSPDDLIDSDGDIVGTITPDGQILDNNGNPVDAVLDPATNSVVPSTGLDNGSADPDDSDTATDNSGNSNSDDTNGDGDGDGETDGSGDGTSGNDDGDENAADEDDEAPAGTDNDGDSPIEIDPATGGGVTSPNGDDNDDTASGNDEDLSVEIDPATGGGVTNPADDNDDGSPAGADDDSSAGGSGNDNTPSDNNEVEIDPATGGGVTDPTGDDDGDAPGDTDNGDSSTGGSGNGETSSDNDENPPVEIDPATGGGVTDPTTDDNGDSAIDTDDDSSNVDSGNGNTPTDSGDDAPVEIDPATGGGVTDPDNNDDDGSGSGDDDGSDNTGTPTPEQCNDPNSGIDFSACAEIGLPGGGGAGGNADANVDEDGNVDAGAGGGVSDGNGNNVGGGGGVGTGGTGNNDGLPNVVGGAGGAGTGGAGTGGAGTGGAGTGDSGAGGAGQGSFDDDEGESGAGGSGEGSFEDGEGESGAGGSGEGTFEDGEGESGAGGSGEGTFEDGEGESGAGGSGEGTFEDGEGESGAGGSGEGSFEDDGGESGAGGAGAGSFEDDEGESGSGGFGEGTFDDDEAGESGSGTGTFDDDEGESGSGGFGEGTFDDDEAGESGSGTGTFDDDEGESGSGGFGEGTFDDDEAGESGSGAGTFEDDEKFESGGGSFNFDDDEEQGSSGGGTGFFKRRMARYM